MRPSGWFGFDHHPIRSSSSTLELVCEHQTPRLIRDRCGVYYFRVIVPLALRDTTGKTELRRSLRTKDTDFAATIVEWIIRNRSWLEAKGLICGRGG